jgi:adenylate cyclase
MERRLAAVLVADIAGYTRLMEAYEFDTHDRLMALRRDLIETAIAGHGGRIIKNTGDGLIAVFSSVNDAVECAVGLQQSIQRQESIQPPDRRIRFRMGLNVGDVVVEAEDVYGNGVNVAARLQDLAEPGGLMISAAVREQVGQNLELPTVDLGNIGLKNIQTPVRAFRVLTGSDSGGSRSIRTSLRRQPSIAVLPFRTIDPDPEQAYFGEGLVEDIIGALAALKDLMVISRNSTLVYRGKDVEVSRIGRDLDVRYVLSGSVRRRGRRLRIAAELADTGSGLVLWAQTFNFDGEDLFDIQERIVAEIVGILAPRVRESEIQLAFLKRPESMDAYDHFLQALALLYRLNERDFTRAGTLVQRAIALDDSYATAYALASEWHGLRIGQGWSPDPAGDSREAVRLAEAAVDRDSMNVRALTLLGHYRSYLFRDYDGALGLFDRALVASPNNAWAWGRSAPTYSYIGDGRGAIERAEQALRLSPQDPLAFYYHTSLCIAHYTCGMYEEAAQWGQISLRENPRYTAAACPTAASLAAMGRNDEAREAARKVLEVNPAFRASLHAARYPYRDLARREQLERHLVAAGLPR